MRMMTIMIVMGALCGFDGSSALKSLRGSPNMCVSYFKTVFLHTAIYRSLHMLVMLRYLNILCVQALYHVILFLHYC